MNKYAQFDGHPLLRQYFIQNPPPSGHLKILELGSNYGSNLAIISQNHLNIDFYGIDINQEAIDLGRQKYGDFITFECADITTYEGELYQQEYDYIILLDVLEHLTYPLECLKKWKKCLKKDGIFIINIPNLMHYTVMYNLLKLGRFPYADIGLLDCTHCHLFTYQQIMILLQEAGLKMTDIKCTLIQDHDKLYDDAMKQFVNELIQYGGTYVNELTYITFTFFMEAKLT